MKIKATFVLIFCFWMSQSWSQTSLQGKVLGDSKPLAEVNIDCYEYNAALKTISTNSSGEFALKLNVGKEYLILFYQSGYFLKAYNVSTYKQTKQMPISLSVELIRDNKSPEGLFFQEVDFRILADNGVASKFDLNKIKPQSHADSLTVLMNRAKTNQYLLVSNLKLNTPFAMSRTVSKELENNLKEQLNKFNAEVNLHKSTAVKKEQLENYFVALSKKTKEEEQLDALTQAQKALAERLGELVASNLAEQESSLTASKLAQVQASLLEQQKLLAKNEEEKQFLEKSFIRLKAASLNAKMDALNANRQFQYHNSLYALQYQEYIELLRYKNKQDEKKLALEKLAAAKTTIANAVIFEKDKTLDSLAKVEPSLRTDMIEQALAEETRFENFEEKETVETINGESFKIKRTRIANDNYELQVDKKFNFKYLKNQKPISKLTYEFETKRRFIDLISTIRKVEKFEKGR